MKNREPTGIAASMPSTKSIATMRGAGVRIASEVITAMITIKPLPDVQPVHSHSRLPNAVATKVRRPLIIA